MYRGGQDNVLHVVEDVILSLRVGLHHLFVDTHGLVLDHATALDPQLQEGLVALVQV